MARYSGNTFTKLITVGPDSISYRDTVWDSVVTTAVSVDPSGLIDEPSYNHDYLGWEFSASLTEVVYIISQLPNRYKLGTDVFPVIKWQPVTADAGNVLWRLEYEWINEGEVQTGSYTTVDVQPNVSGQAYLMEATSFGAISKPNSGIFSTIVTKISRVGGSDTFSSNVIFKELNIYFEVDSPGARTAFTK